MATNKYDDIEIQTAKNLLKEGYKWIARDESGGLFAYIDKPSKLDTFWCSDGNSNCVCYYVPIFQNVRFVDKEPTILEAIVHPQILDDAERRYLKAVIRPFRDRVKHICKVNYSGTSSSEYQYLFITLSDISYNIDLPIFKRDTMYKGMKKGHDYTIEELGV